MTIPFYKYQGTGNDFIIIDNVTESHEPVPQDTDMIEKICDRKFGIGADGVIFLQKHPSYDFEMVYYNPDASKSFCGNGSRCAVHLANQLGIIKNDSRFLAIDGEHTAHIDAENGLISVSMRVNVVRPTGLDYFADTGAPHYIHLVSDVLEFDLLEYGAFVNSWPYFKKSGVNVNIVEFLDFGNVIMLSMRTYERGVNAETLSCGTGAVAAALMASIHLGGRVTSPIVIMTSGGYLQVSFVANEGVFTDVYLIGPAKPVFQGQLDYQKKHLGCTA